MSSKVAKVKNMISTTNAVKKIFKYLQIKGWKDEALLFKRVIESIEKTDKEKELILIIENHSSLELRKFFENDKFKKFAEGHPYLSPNFRIFELWTAIDTALCCAEWFFNKNNVNN